MTRPPGAARQFCVRSRHADGHHARFLEEATFEAAAVAYVEDIHPSVADGDEFSVIVCEVGTGLEHCFRIDLESGKTAPCD